ncbi:MAG TPA: hypothetical protein VK518_14400 [Puia sp.]|nr:hypothetical protein [Puia sp.]
MIHLLKTIRIEDEGGNVLVKDDNIYFYEMGKIKALAVVQAGRDRVSCL